PARQQEIASLAQEMERCVAQTDRQQEPRPATAPVPEGASPLLPATLVIGGAVLAAAGVVAVASRSRGPDCAPNCNPDAVDGLRVRYGIGWAAIGVGAASLATGALVWVVRRAGSGSTRSAHFAPGFRGALVTGRF